MRFLILIMGIISKGRWDEWFQDISKLFKIENNSQFFKPVQKIWGINLLLFNIVDSCWSTWWREPSTLDVEEHMLDCTFECIIITIVITCFIGPTILLRTHSPHYVPEITYMEVLVVGPYPISLGMTMGVSISHLGSKGRYLIWIALVCNYWI